MAEHGLSTLGLAMRAGRVIYGADSVKNEIKKAKGILLSADAGDAIRREAVFLANANSIPLIKLPYDKQTLGRAIGKELCSILTVTDKGLLTAITRQTP